MATASVGLVGGVCAGGGIVEFVSEFVCRFVSVAMARP
jgi:hypothetical protein